MVESTGRHRRRRRRRSSRVRWWFAAIVSLVPSRPQKVRRQAEVRVPRDTRPQRPNGARAAERVPSAPPPSRLPARNRAADELGWISNYNAASSGHSTSWGNAFDSASPQAGAVPPPRRFREVERGWCVDDTGISAVRPYLVRHEERMERMARAHGRAPGQTAHSEPQSGGRHRVTPVPDSSGGEEEGVGEFDDLARAIRQWQALTG